MRLTHQTDYALRLLMHLAVRGDELTTIAQSSERYDISKNHLMKIAHHLGQMGYIETVRGRSGGLRLARTADQIRIGELVRLLEADSTLVACFPGGSGNCMITKACRLKGALNKAMEAFFQTLDEYSLDDLVSDNTPLYGLLAPNE